MVDPSEFTFGFEFIKDYFVAFNTLYLIWMVAYYTIILGICRNRIKRKNHWTFIAMQVDQSKTATKLKNKYGMAAACFYFSIKHYIYCVVNG
eukprot:CAMPEP_0168347146 /NCGR_PEP_ID=MMETSP0213-20121227/18801_1 /TAXON_ID=151035 /ORGANISM="Euplotes harpa, Strain FSP1.4" /LENGTH=91 /DNA_ID=CAMNT_0008356149 /DNA_START=1 /DNA_END=272 /DNA_ORIENTATION=+